MSKNNNINIFELSPLTKALRSRGLNNTMFATLASTKGYPVVRATYEVMCLEGGGDPDIFLSHELEAALMDIGINVYQLEDDLRAWRRNLPYSDCQLFNRDQDNMEG